MGSETWSGKTGRSLSRRRLLRGFGTCGALASLQYLLPLSPLAEERKDIFARSLTPPDSGSPVVQGGDPSELKFVDVATRAGLGTAQNSFGGADSKRYLLEETGCGVAFFDYDNDGWLDIFLVNGAGFRASNTGKEPSNYLFRNNRAGSFTDVTKQAGLSHSGWGQGCCIGDYDNDGYEDLFVTYWGKNVLYHNNGDGTFTDVTEKAGLSSTERRWGTGCCFLDYDLDGYLDLFVANYVNFDPRLAPLPGSSSYCQLYGIPVACGPKGLGGGTNTLYRNRGNGFFEDVSEKCGVTNPRGPSKPTSTPSEWRPVGSYGFTAVAADFDNDGWPDIYVACDSAPSLLYRNNRNGTFTEVGIAAGCALNPDGEAQAGMGVGVGDYDCDGWLDIIKTNFSDDIPNLYHNEGDGTFSDVASQAGLQVNTRFLGWGAGFVDLDNDGWKDIFVANGHVYPEIDNFNLPLCFRERKLLYRNLGNGHFEDVSLRAGPAIALARSSRGCAFGDFDNDGDVDIVISNMNDPPSLLRNEGGNRNNWVMFKCLGTHSNRSAIGTRVRVVTGQHAQIEEIMSGSSYLSQNDLRLHFGVGRATKVDLVEVRWPSGFKESFRNVEANCLVFVREGHGIIKTQHMT